MAGEALKLAVNVPETIALEFSDGLPVESKFGGDQILFTLVDGRRYYAPTFVAQKIAAAGIAARTPFSICKRETVVGNRRTVKYEIGAPEIGAAGLSQSPAAPVANKPTPTTIPAANVHVMPAPAPAVAPVVAPVVAPPSDSSRSAISFAGMAAVDAVLEVEAYARGKGLVDFSFDGEQISKIWMTLYIDARKGGRA